MKTKSPYRKLQEYLFLVIYGITFVRLAWLMVEGANPRPILFIMACCAVWFAFIGLITALAEKNVQKRKQERDKRHGWGAGQK